MRMGGAQRWAEEVEQRGYREVQGEICLGHVTDTSFLRDLMDDASPGDCVLCGTSDDQPTMVSAETLVASFMDSFRYFYRTSDSLPWDNEDGVYIGPQIDTGDAVYDLASEAFEVSVIDDALQLISDAIGYEHEWTTWGAPADPDGVDYEWSRFVETVKYTSRFVFIVGGRNSGLVAQFLRKVGKYLDEENGLISTLPVDTPLHRGRLCEKPREVSRSAAGLGPAPRDQASANRMSPPGISMFYGSDDAETAVAEIAGHGVSPLAVVGEFRTTRVLRVLDLTARPNKPSPLNRERRVEFEMLSFLESFVEAITAPVIPDGRQHVEYVPTQVVTEYLRNSSPEMLDGIVLPSTQTGRRTYVLFFDSDGVTDAGNESAPHTLRDELLGFGASQPALTLDPSRITTYRVIRTYGIKPAGRFADFA